MEAAKALAIDSPTRASNGITIPGNPLSCTMEAVKALAIDSPTRAIKRPSIASNTVSSPISAGSLTPAPSATESQTDTLEGAPHLDIEVDTSPLAQEPEQSEKPQAEKPQAEKPSPYRPIQDWLPHRQAFLDELLRQDGRKGIMSQCCSTLGCTDTGSFLCRDCMHCNSFCQRCLVERHQHLPFHRIMRWTGLFYDDTTLQSLGLILQLGHGGSPCANPGLVQKLTVVDVSGVHEISLRYCECHQATGGSRVHVQLLRACLFPATVIFPRKAFTFDVLDTFHLMTLQGKISAYDFYTTLSHKSDNTGLRGVKNCYPQFLTAIRIWRHLKILKRSGRGNDPAGAAATRTGQCAMECPACPQPGRNLPPNWENASKDRSWLYSLNLTIDANFRLKNKARGIKNDPPLGDGWAHWVSEQPYQAYLEKYGHQAEPNLCDSDLHAVDHANTRFSQGYTSTGVGGVLCARHSLVRKNGMGNLQKGERYANMDFIVFSGLVDTNLRRFLFSYDVACQWWKNLVKRIPQLPESMQLNSEQLAGARYVIPKFHIYAHGSSCQTLFSLNFLPFMARTNGEEPERWWAHINPVSMSTKEMGPGARLDTLDDHACAWNWRKITGLGSGLAAQLRKAIHMAQEHKSRHAELTGTFPDDVTQKWETMVAAWNNDPGSTNPYVEPVISTSTTTLRLELAKEEAARTEETMPHEMSPSAFIRMGLDLEEQQRSLSQYSIDQKTLTQEGDIEERRNVLRWRIRAWMDVRNIYIPALADDQDSGSSAASAARATPELMPLKLPSSMTPTLRSTCFQSLPDIERRLRVAQADDCLSDLRKQLRITMGLNRYKFTQVGPSQRAGTRARSLISRFHEKTKRCADRYRAALSALTALDPDGDWSSRLRPLADTDIRPPRRGDDEAEGTRELSWIWRVDRRNGLSGIQSQGGVDPMGDEELTECLRCEWAKSKARADRWNEEVLLLVEEMRRVISFLDWKSSWWKVQAVARSGLPTDIADGVAAYAAKQAHLNRSLAAGFAAQWHPILIANGFPIEWPVPYRTGIVDNIDRMDVG